MPRLPVPHKDTNVWGNILNEFLQTEHLSDGTLAIRTDGTLHTFYKKPHFDQVDNTADHDKPVSQATQAALDAKANADDLNDIVALTIALA